MSVFSTLATTLPRLLFLVGPESMTPQLVHRGEPLRCAPPPALVLSLSWRGKVTATSGMSLGRRGERSSNYGGHVAIILLSTTWYSRSRDTFDLQSYRYRLLMPNRNIHNSFNRRLNGFNCSTGSFHNQSVRHLSNMRDDTREVSETEDVPR